MAQITCKCGNTYDSKFKFCPECAEPNPLAIKKKAKLTEVSEEIPEKTIKKKFKKVGEGGLRTPNHDNSLNKSYSIVRQGQPKSIPNSSPAMDPEDLYEEYEDDEETLSELGDTDEETIYDYEDDSIEDNIDSGENYVDPENFEDYSDEESSLEDLEDEEYDTSEDSAAFSSREKSKVLTAPSVKPIKKVSTSNITKLPKAKNIASTRSSLGKRESEYDPNHDGYYDDRLPAILDEVTKTSHLDVFLKIGLSAVCIAALITYCIFYVQV